MFSDVPSVIVLCLILLYHRLIFGVFLHPLSKCLPSPVFSRHLKAGLRNPARASLECGKVSKGKRREGSSVGEVCSFYSSLDCCVWEMGMSWLAVASTSFNSSFSSNIDVLQVYLFVIMLFSHFSPLTQFFITPVIEIV